MAAQHIDAILVTTEPELRYYAGFDTQFWASPTRPWYLVLPRRGEPIAVIPEIGIVGMAQTWVEDIRTWPAPCPDDDGVTLLTQTLSSVVPGSGRIGLPLGLETHLRMPAGDFLTLRERLSPRAFIDAGSLLQKLRAIKSESEVAKIRWVCELTSRGFKELGDEVRPGQSEREICARLRQRLLALGADDSPYLVAVSGPGGYSNIIMGPSNRVLADQDVLVIDTGTRYDGYYCDFDRNYAVGRVSAPAQRAYHTVYAATDAGLNAARPGVTCDEIFRVMWSVLEGGGTLGNNVGRMGHGIGLQLTEWPSIRRDEAVALEPGMVITLEPGMEFAPGQMMVHEENIVITEDGAELLTHRAPPEITIL